MNGNLWGSRKWQKTLRKLFSDNCCYEVQEVAVDQYLLLHKTAFAIYSNMLVKLFTRLHNIEWFWLLCAEVYGKVSNASLKSLQSVQNWILRALQYRNRYFSISQMHKSYGILKIQDIVQCKQSKLIHSLLTEDKKLPVIYKKLIVPTKNIHLLSRL